MRYIAMTTLGAAALMLVCAPAVSQAQSTTTTDQQQTTTDKSTTEQKPSMMQKMEDKTKSAASTTEQKTKKATSAVSDTWVTSKVKMALMGDPDLKGHKIKVTTKKGTVTLTGTVGSEDAKTAVGDKVKGVEHVKAVKNELQVSPMGEHKQTSRAATQK